METVELYDYKQAATLNYKKHKTKKILKKISDSQHRKILQINNEERWNKQLKIAHKLCCDLHRGHFRKDGITPFIEHPIMVCEKLNTSYERIVGLLYDTLVLYRTSADYLIEKGIDSEFVTLIKYLIKMNGESSLEFVHRLKGVETALLVKKADLEDHISFGYCTNLEIENMELFLHALSIKDEYYVSPLAQQNKRQYYTRKKKEFDVASGVLCDFSI